MCVVCCVCVYESVKVGTLYFIILSYFSLLSGGALKQLQILSQLPLQGENLFARDRTRRTRIHTLTNLKHYTLLGRFVTQLETEVTGEYTKGVRRLNTEIDMNTK